MRKNIVNTLWIIVGNFVLVIGVTAFLLPHNILSGGITGFAVASESIFNVEKEYIINGCILTAFVLGVIILGKQFALKTVVSSIVYPILLMIIKPWMPFIAVDEAVASLYGGMICGIGLGIVMRCGASTGGMDVFSLILNKLFHIKISHAVLLLDTCVALLGFFTCGIASVLIGYIAILSTSFMVNKVLNFDTHQKAVKIISDKHEIINAQIHKEIHRGTTIETVNGGYTGESKTVIYCVVKADQYTKLIQLVDEIDNHAFIVTTNAVEAKGEGFDYIYSKT
ncbi:uncharacterized membrane-anchored protein YitT (DUF2179 family) [Breznakia blatticola]|uniref:Uncharacterized membrane-anchored protein YitT (DUF2179 family) n=1 Tax=Breznakia blatticola TaxID=1754012 RepID=A0A4R7ZFI5_9FIRM|nr:YitT family protein [Breznakia blatticola]TDW09485.1 uncharacterized membrane-anchored protein YitT (DUF2179 family) [Breznakia blatticola]